MECDIYGDKRKRPNKIYPKDSVLPYDDLVINENFLRAHTTNNIGWPDDFQINLFAHKVTIPEFGISRTCLRDVKRKYRDLLFPRICIKKIDDEQNSGPLLRLNLPKTRMDRFDRRFNSNLRNYLKKPQLIKVAEVFKFQDPQNSPCKNHMTPHSNKFAEFLKFQEQSKNIKISNKDCKQSQVLKFQEELPNTSGKDAVLKIAEPQYKSSSRKRQLTRLENLHGKRLNVCDDGEAVGIVSKLKEIVEYFESRPIRKNDLQQPSISETNLNEINHELVFNDDSPPYILDRSFIENETSNSLPAASDSESFNTKTNQPEVDVYFTDFSFSSDDEEIDEPIRPENISNNGENELSSQISISTNYCKENEANTSGRRESNVENSKEALSKSTERNEQLQEPTNQEPNVENFKECRTKCSEMNDQVEKSTNSKSIEEFYTDFSFSSEDEEMDEPKRPETRENTLLYEKNKANISTERESNVENSKESFNQCTQMKDQLKEPTNSEDIRKEEAVTSCVQNQQQATIPNQSNSKEFDTLMAEKPAVSKKNQIEMEKLSGKSEYIEKDNREQEKFSKPIKNLIVGMGKAIPSSSKDNIEEHKKDERQIGNLSIPIKEVNGNMKIFAKFMPSNKENIEEMKKTIESRDKETKIKTEKLPIIIKKEINEMEEPTESSDEDDTEERKVTLDYFSTEEDENEEIISIEDSQEIIELTESSEVEVIEEISPTIIIDDSIIFIDSESEKENSIDEVRAIKRTRNINETCKDPKSSVAPSHADSIKQNYEIVEKLLQAVENIKKSTSDDGSSSSDDDCNENRWCRNGIQKQRKVTEKGHGFELSLVKYDCDKHPIKLNRNKIEEKQQKECGTTKVYDSKSDDCFDEDDSNDSQWYDNDDDAGDNQWCQVKNVEIVEEDKKEEEDDEKEVCKEIVSATQKKIRYETITHKIKTEEEVGETDLIGANRDVQREETEREEEENEDDENYSATLDNIRYETITPSINNEEEGEIDSIKTNKDEQRDESEEDEEKEEEEKEVEEEKENEEEKGEEKGEEDIKYDETSLLSDDLQNTEPEPSQMYGIEIASFQYFNYMITNGTANQSSFGATRFTTLINTNINGRHEYSAPSAQGDQPGTDSSPKTRRRRASS